MNSKNKVNLLGRVGKDVELTRTAGGLSIAKTTIATSGKYKDKDGNTVEETEWHNLVIFGKLAEVAEKYVKKGDLIDVEGRIKTGSWEKDGVKHYKTEIIVSDLVFLTKKSGDVAPSVTPSVTPSFTPSTETFTITGQPELPESDGLPF